MSRVFQVDDYFLGVWYAEKTDYGNWMMTVIKDKEGVWHGEYRFRYFVDTKIHNSKDRRSFYSFLIPKEETEEQIIGKLSDMFDLIKIRYPNNAKFIEIKGDYQKYVFRMAQEEFFHIRKVRKGDPGYEECESLCKDEESNRTIRGVGR